MKTFDLLILSSAFQEIITNASIDVKIRWLSSVYFKNGIDKYWRKNATK